MSTSGSGLRLPPAGLPPPSSPLPPSAAFRECWQRLSTSGARFWAAGAPPAPGPGAGGWATPPPRFLALHLLHAGVAPRVGPPLGGRERAADVILAFFLGGVRDPRTSCSAPTSRERKLRSGVRELVREPRGFPCCAVVVGWLLIRC